MRAFRDDSPGAPYGESLLADEFAARDIRGENAGDAEDWIFLPKLAVLTVRLFLGS